MNVWRRGSLISATVLLTACAAPKLARITIYAQINDALTAGIFLDADVRAVLPADVPLRPVSEQGLSVTKRSEGWRSTLYNDAVRYCTIGYGHLVKKAPCNGSEPAAFLGGITEPQGARLLQADMISAQTVVMTTVTSTLSDSQYAALCDFVYNVGGGVFRRSTLLEVVNAGRHEEVAAQLRRYVLANGREIAGLRSRREAEVFLYYGDQFLPRAAPPTGLPLDLVDIRIGE